MFAFLTNPSGSYPDQQSLQPTRPFLSGSITHSDGQRSRSPYPINYCLRNLSRLCKFFFGVPCLACVPSEPCFILGLDFGSRSSRNVPHLSSTPHKVSTKTAKTPFRRTIRTPSRRDDSRGYIRERQSITLRNPLWNDLDFVPGRVKPRSTFSSYPTMSPLRISQLGYRKDFHFTETKPISPEPSLIPEKIAQLQTFDLTLPCS